MRVNATVTTQCPQCGTPFTVTMAQLQLRKGFVRCVHCAHIFDGYETIVADADADATLNAVTQAAAQTPIHTIRPVPDVIRQRHTITFIAADGDTDVAGEPQFSISDPEVDTAEFAWRLDEAKHATTPTSTTTHAPQRALADPSPEEPEVSPEDITPLPDFLEDTAHRPWVTWCWGSLCALALLGALAQASVVYRLQLANQFPLLRPALERLCRTWNCQVAYPRLVDQIAILSSSLRMQPNHDPRNSDPPNRHLILHATLRNQAERAQQWPSLRLDLTDLSGAVVIRKHLAASDYLPAELAHAPFAARSDVAITLPLRVEGVSVNGYQITPFFP